MNSDQVFDAIEAIAAVSGKKDKERLVANLLDDELGARVLKAAYDPFVTYGIAKVPEPITFDDEETFGESTWLLLDRLAKRELTGNAARDAVQGEIDNLSRRSQDLFKRILTKDLRAGFTDGTINRARPGTITVFDCMLAHPFKDYKAKVKYPVYVEPKLDGVRVLAFVRQKGAEVRFFSRSGKEFTTFDALKNPIGCLIMNWLAADQERLQAYVDEDFVLDGEVVAGSFNKTVGDVRRKGEQAVDAKFCVFDLLTVEEFESPNSKDECYIAGAYTSRRNRLMEIVPEADGAARVFRLPAIKCHGEDEVHALYEKMRARGLEGVIVKDTGAFYARKRSAAWLKIKAEEDVTLKVTDTFEGTGKYAGMLGGLYVDFNGVQVAVGSGFSDEQRREFWNEWEYEPTALIGREIDVQYHEVTPDGSLRHPRFVRFRDALTGARE